MSTAVVPAERTVVSVNGSQSNGAPLYIGGNQFSVQMDGPASIGIIELSNDKTTWFAETTSVADDSISDNTIRALWVRAAVETDGTAPRTFRFRFMVYREN